VREISHSGGTPHPILNRDTLRGIIGPFETGTKMRVIALVVLLCTFSEVAIAQTTQCQSIPKASDRLACYDKAAPPTAAGKSAASKTPAALDKAAGPSKTPTDQAQVVDMLAAENSKLDAKLKTICRGC
jgi:hypothetical protein